MILVVRCIERIGDHAVDIGEQTSFLVTGQFERVHRCVALTLHRCVTSHHRSARTGAGRGNHPAGPSNEQGETSMRKTSSACCSAVIVALGDRRDRRTGRAGAGEGPGSSLVGTGATFPFPLISKWIPGRRTRHSDQHHLLADRLRRGIAQITARTVDFGASDAPLSPDQLSACKGCTVIPWALAATSVPYNMPGPERPLKLDSAASRTSTSARSRTGTTPRSSAINPGRNLPDLKITPVYRSDGSARRTLHRLPVGGQPGLEEQGRHNTSVNLPSGIGARGSSGVAGVVSQTEGALTYVDAAFSITNKLQFALIRNSAGRYTTPGIRGITAALSKLPAKVTKLSQLKIVDPPKSAGRLAYPISTFTYVIVPLKSGDKAADLRKFVYWAVTHGPEVRPAALLRAAAEDGAGVRVPRDQEDPGQVARATGPDVDAVRTRGAGGRPPAPRHPARRPPLQGRLRGRGSWRPRSCSG